ncbi:MAG: 16S rRNA (guanine(966)-N(2))-methyltransferase RsmD [Acidobacteria bacterium]|nr:16S rRNA (guanine(966)-N(2))-methyltransferase RsmD [Acidobacteriota bacterium]
MRVIAGSLKGRRLKAPTWEGLRPTSDKLRETLFDILAPRIAGARVLDGYAGTGAVGIEALSRGAAAVTFVESDRRAEALIAENLAHCGVAGGYAIIRQHVERALLDLRAAPQSAMFDLVFLDPPYESTRGDAGGTHHLDDVVAAAADVLAAHGLVVLEHARRWNSPESAGAAHRARVVASGDSALSFYELKREN